MVEEEFEKIQRGDENSRFCCTLEAASLDDAHHQCLVHSQLKVFNFDQIAQFYSRRCLGKKSTTCSSNDALFYNPHSQRWAFIEFKAGKSFGYKDEKTNYNRDLAQIRQKIYDSFLIFIEKIIPNEKNPMNYMRFHVDYFLVYNKENRFLAMRIPESESRNQMGSLLAGLADNPSYPVNYSLWGLNYFEHYMFRRVCTINHEEFQDRVSKRFSC